MATSSSGDSGPSYLGWKLLYRYGTVSRATFRDAYMAGRAAPDPTAGIPPEALAARAEYERICARWATIKKYLALGWTEQVTPSGATYVVDAHGHKIANP